jgi:hypothetical protein
VLTPGSTKLNDSVAADKEAEQAPAIARAQRYLFIFIVYIFWLVLGFSLVVRDKERVFLMRKRGGKKAHEASPTQNRRSMRG